jgi:glycosyltransferase involved in cell wall biosynthesis
METYCEDYLNTSLPGEFDIIFCRAILIKSVFTTTGLLRFLLRCLNSAMISVVWAAMSVARRPDVVHIHTNSYAGFYIKGLLSCMSRLLGAKTVMHVHGAEFKSFYGGCGAGLRRLIRGLLNVNHRLVVLSKEWRGFFESIGVRSERITVMTNCVFLPELTGPSGRSGKPIVLYLSRFERRKGLHELMAVLENRRDLLDSFQFVLAGPKSHDWEALDRRVRDSRMTDAVKLPGPLMGEEKDRAYRRASVYLLQSHNEGMPIGLLEAMSYGLACISTPVGGIPDVIESGRNGLMIPPGDEQALAATLDKLASDKPFRESLGTEARATIEQRYSWPAREKELSELYRSLLAI